MSLVDPIYSPTRDRRPLSNSFSSLVRYIDTYRDPNAEQEVEEEPEVKNKPWWRGGGKAAGKSLSEFVAPTEWLTTDIRDGLNTMEVERRRKQAGWNELSTEKENMVSSFMLFLYC